MAAKRKAVPSPEPEDPPSYLLEETQLMVDAQRLLNGGAPDSAMALLDRHRALFPGGKLAQERDAARILALCALGRTGEARRARDRFEQDWPGSALSRRVRASCAGAVEPAR
jgi:RNA polymerase sigma-70 factor (ECF subfamily)